MSRIEPSAPDDEADAAAIPYETSIGKAPYEPTRDRERVRGLLAAALIGLLSIVVLGLFVALLAGRLTIPELGQLAAVTISPIVGLLGAVLGFYFGEQSRDRPR